ncbi:MAG: DUF1553 domain-containing protein [Verrucomicrobiales bacterium]|nr:DUF1553 domain-containing protein [Verrucomicrobiales bacterium]
MRPTAGYRAALWLMAWAMNLSVIGIIGARSAPGGDLPFLQPITNPPLPIPRDSQWSRQPLDHFILAHLERVGLSPARETDRVTWLRRATFDLTGLPPTPEEVAALEADHSVGADERIVDRLLASPRYGERWAQHWLDVVRFADTHGFEVNTERPNAWPYRDYVIRAFNRDLPYDQFIREQIAGDQWGEDAATGFLLTASALLPGQIGADEPSKRLARQDALDEIIVNIGQTFLGLTIGCARCHDHKTDPISQHDYYAMQAFVAGVEYEDRDLRTPEANALRAEEGALKTELAQVQADLTRYTPRVGETSDHQSLADGSAKPDLGPTAALPSENAVAVRQLKERQKRIEARLAQVAIGQRAFAGNFRQPDLIRVLRRGDPEQPRDEVAPAVPRAMGALELPKDAADPQRRIALADWIASPRNPLTARVMVNRIWQGHFGTGLVDTSSDFGRNGGKASHPELLDWLASEFIASGWSLKHIHRLIVLSATYRQAATPDSQGEAIDAESRFLWRFPPRRLEAETIRDAMLAVSGHLNLAMYGRGFDLFDKRGGLTGFKPVESFDVEGRRRMIYAHKVRREREAVFGAFDCPDAGQSTARRRESTTPIQALNLFNSRFTIDEAEAFADRVQSEAGPDIDRQIQQAYRRALARDPHPEERVEAEPVVRHHGLAVLCRALFNSNEFLFLP